MRKSLIIKKSQKVWFMNILSKWRAEPLQRVQALSSSTPRLNGQGEQLLVRDDTLQHSYRLLSNYL